MAYAQAHREQLRKENLELQLAVEKERAARLRIEERLGARHISASQTSDYPVGAGRLQAAKK